MLRLLARLRYRLLRAHPAKLLVLGYASYMLIGWIMLSLPGMTEQTVSGLDHLFIAVSAVSTTGLATIDPGVSYSFWGELVIIVLIQIGGIGYMAFSSFIILSAVNPKSRLCVKIAQSTFQLPEGFEVRSFLRHVIVFTFLCEGIGTLLLYIVFNNDGNPDALWSAIFHSISAFCTAGFSLNSDSFMGYADNTMVNLVIAFLCYAGSIGFLVVSDVWRVFTGQKARLGFTSKIIFRLTLFLSLAGTALFALVAQWPDDMASWQILLASFFQVMTAQTTVGFNTMAIGDLALPMVMIIYFLMIFGASPAGTGGGLKNTTLAVLIGVVRSVAKQRAEVSFQRRVIPAEVRTTAIAACAMYIFLLGTAVFLLSMTEAAGFETILFEALSAMGTVGLSMGLTGELSELGKLVVVLLMFAGRVGFVTIGIAAAARDDQNSRLDEDESFVI